MRRIRGEESGVSSDVDKPGTVPLLEAVQEDPEEGREERVKPPSERLAPATELAEALAKVRRLEVELQRYRDHAERTSRLFALCHEVRGVGPRECPARLGARSSQSADQGRKAQHGLRASWNGLRVSSRACRRSSRAYRP